MFKKFYSLLAMVCAATMCAFAATQPTISEGDQVTWYLVQFLNQSNVLEAKGDGEGVRTAEPTGADAQLWKIEGNDTDGYTFTSKTGLMLYTTSTATNGMFRAASAPTSNTRFVWTTTTNATYSGGFVISPKANTGVYMNQWEGAGTNKELGLWSDRADANQPLEFVSSEALLSKLPKLSLIPYPKSLTMGEGSLKVSDIKGISYVDEPTHRYADEFAAQLQMTSGVSLSVGAASGVAITMTSDATLAHEAYKLSISADGVKISAADSTGFFYAIQTIKQLLPAAIYGKTAATSAAWELPYVEIADQPEFSHRGFMLDVARHFFSKEEIKRLLCVAASYKMNRFHWHLTDDQGWRVEIPEYPKLTEVGSVRAGSLINAGGASKFFDDTEYGHGMWFTLDDLREIVKFAKDLNIEILPEVDLPGHMVAAVTAYPEFSCDPSKTYSVRIDSGISKDVLNVGDDKVIEFLKCVLGHIAEVFPYPYIHIGGDECPTDQWATNAACLQRVKDKGLTGVNQLQSWLVEELGTFLKDEYGKDIVVWDELLSHWSADNKIKPVIMAWNSLSKTSDAANKGFKSIATPYSHVYLDFPQVDDSQADINEKYQGGWGVNTLQEVYGLNPAGSLSGRESYCMGVQGNMWTETCSDSIQLEYQLFPRLLALSETGWLPSAEKDWVSFRHRMQSHDDVLDAFGVTYAKHSFTEEPQTDAEFIMEVFELLQNYQPGEVGYASVEDYDNLLTTLFMVNNAMSTIDDLKTEYAKFKKAPVTMPEVGKTYKITSASTYYKAKYEGSAIYNSGKGIRFHYYPQQEPEELWTVESAGEEGYILTSRLDGGQITLGNNGQMASLTDAGTALRIDGATIASGKYDYVPGVVTISAVANYATAPRRLFADCSGSVKADANGAICYPGTWRFELVEDYTEQLQGLVKKAQLVLRTAKTGEMNQPSAEALSFLSEQVLTPAQAELAEGGVISEATYQSYLDLYAQFLAMPRTSILDALSEEYYYRIRNAYFTDYYAAAVGTAVAPRTIGAGGDEYSWQIKKNADGTITLINKKTNSTPYAVSSTQDSNVLLGQDYAWTIEEITTDLGNSALAIVDKSGTYSWYTNPSVWSNNIIFKPKDWGASIWNFEQLNETTGITTVVNDAAESEDVIYYDLQGRRVNNPTNGLYITNKRTKVAIME